MSDSFGVPGPTEVRNLLEGYGLSLQSTLNRTGTWGAGSAIITGINTVGLAPFMSLYGTGIPALAQILSVDIVSATVGQITMNVPAVSAQTGGALVVTYYTVLSDQWIQDRITKRVLPWVSAKTKMSFQGVQTVTEYYDGTGSPLMILRRKPIQQLISISYTNVDSNLYYLTPTAMQVISDEGILKAKANFNESSYIPIFFRGDRNIRITYSYGFNTVPAEVVEALTMLTACECLEHLASKTGGGNLTVQAFSRDFGDAGRWANHRKNLAKTAYALLRPYITGGFS